MLYAGRKPVTREISDLPRGTAEANGNDEERTCASVSPSFDFDRAKARHAGNL